MYEFEINCLILAITCIKLPSIVHAPSTSCTSGSGTSNEENRKRKRERDTDTDSLEDRIDSIEKLAKVKGSKIVTK